MNRAILVASAIALLPASAFAYINAGFKSQAEYDRYLRKERWAKIGRATEAIRRDPKDAVAYFYRGNIYYKGDFGKLPNYEAALADYDKAIELNSKFSQAYFRRGQLRLSIYQEKLHETPEMKEAWELPAPAYHAWRQKMENTSPWRLKRAEALADLEKAAQLRPDFIKAQVFFAVNTKNIAKAIKASKTACEHTNDKNAICVELLASFYAKSGDFDNAVRWQEKAVKLSPTFPEEAKKRLENYRRKKPNEWDIRWDSLTER